MPCFKLGIRLGRPDVVKRFLRSGRTGFYLAVTREGEVAAGDPIECADSQEQGLTVADVANLYTADPADTELLRRASELPALPEGWKARFRERLREAGA
jgi:MOSC domain-containing protein YiiM